MDPTTAATGAPAEQTAKAELMAKLVYVLYLASLVVGSRRSSAS